MKTIACALTAVAALGASGACAMPMETTTAEARVSYADLDLATAAGRATLKQRVDRAVRTLCPSPSPLNVVSLEHFRDCRASAWTSVRPQMAAIYGQDRYAARGRIVRATSD